MLVATSKPAFDREAAMARVGGDTELLRELAELFREEYPRSLAHMREAIDSHNPIELRNAAHGIKGSVANFGAKPAVDAAWDLEKMGRDARLADAPQALAALEQALASLQTELSAI